MSRYYLLATVLVIGALAIGANSAHRGPPLDVKSVQATGSPSPARVQAASTLVPGAVTGKAPWALSALPECFVQESQARGPLAFVLAQLPPRAAPVPHHVVSRVGDCAVHVLEHSALVERGAEALTIPPDARFWVAGSRLAYVRTIGRSAELRVYRRTNDSPFVFVAEPPKGPAHANCRTTKRKC